MGAEFGFRRLDFIHNLVLGIFGRWNVGPTAGRDEKITRKLVGGNHSSGSKDATHLSNQAKRGQRLFAREVSVTMDESIF